MPLLALSNLLASYFPSPTTHSCCPTTRLPKFSLHLFPPIPLDSASMSSARSIASMPRGAAIGEAPPCRRRSAAENLRCRASFAASTSDLQRRPSRRLLTSSSVSPPRRWPATPMAKLVYGHEEKRSMKRRSHMPVTA